MRSTMSYAYIERRKALKYLAWHWALCILAFWVLLFIFMPISHLFTERFSDSSLKNIGIFFNRSFHNPFFVWKQFFSWFWQFIFYEPRHYTWFSFIGWRLPLLPTLAFVIVAWYYFLNNPYDYRPQYFGYGREARPTDLKQMGLDKGKYL